MKELFKALELFPDYEVSNKGNIRNILTGNIFPGILHQESGYLYVNIRSYRGKKYSKSIHSLVAEVWVEGYQPGFEINHKDGIKTNNFADNLEWGTRQHNIEHSRKVLRKCLGEENGTSKLSEIEVLEIRSSNLSRKALSEVYGVSEVQISNIKLNKSWRHI